MTKVAPLHTHWIDGRNDRKTETREKLCTWTETNTKEFGWKKEREQERQAGRDGVSAASHGMFVRRYSILSLALETTLID
jgi:hypothetical protein